jgi:hypothetical protein
MKATWERENEARLTERLIAENILMKEFIEKVAAGRTGWSQEARDVLEDRDHIRQTGRKRKAS